MKKEKQMEDVSMSSGANAKGSHPSTGNTSVGENTIGGSKRANITTTEDEVEVVTRQDHPKKERKEQDKRAECWTLFDEIPGSDPPKAQCKNCGQTYLCQRETHGTTNLVKHMKRGCKGANDEKPSILSMKRASEEEQDEVVASEEEQVEETSESGEESEIERELANYTFGELQKALADGSRNIAQRRKKSENKPKRANKNRPVEETSKKPVRRFRQVINVPKREVRDPRFDSLSGNLDEEGFRKRYSFLVENLRSERENLRKQLNASNDPEVINDLKRQVNWVEKQLKSESGKHIDAEILADHKKKQREAIKQGKGIFFLKESEIRKQRLIAKYNALKESGKLDAFLEKKRRRNAAKDRRYLPYRRPESSEQ